MAKILKKGDVFNGWSIKLIGLQLKKMYGIDLAITGNNGKNYFKKRLEGVYNVYFMKHWSTFGEIYDAANQQITNIVKDPEHKTIYEHWRGFAHPEVFDKYSTKAVKQGEYNHNFNTNDGPRLVFAREGQASFVFWGVYELDSTDNRTKTKIWVRKSDTYTPKAGAKPTIIPDKFVPAVIKTAIVKPAGKPVVVKTVTVKPVNKPVVVKTVTVKPIGKPVVAKTVIVKPAGKPAIVKTVVKPVAPVVAKKVAIKKAVARKAVKKAIVRKAVKKAVAKKVVRKAVAKKVVAKKVAAKKAAK